MKYELVIFDASDTLYDSKTNKVFDSILKLLPELKKKGIKIALATNLGRHSAESFLEESGLIDLLDYMACADDAAFKPAPDMIELIMDEAWVQPEDTLMVGDTLQDMQAARSAGVAGCLAAWSKSNDMEDLIPEYHAEEVQDLWRIIGLAEAN